MRERPILFSAPMVQALLEGRKTQTRRIINDDWWGCLDPDEAKDRKAALVQCPYGVPGDRLWVRENWALEDCGRDGQRVVYEADRAAAWVVSPEKLGEIHYLESSYRPRRWKPNIFMFRWASRLTLEVTAVRVERLQAISDADAQAEGCPGSPGGSHPMGDDGTEPREEFQALWRSINGPGSWEANPWVWVVEFRRVEPGP